MPELRQVFEMVTKQAEPDMDAWREQERRQRQRSRNRKLGALAVAAAIGIVAVVVVTRAFRSAERPADEPTPRPAPRSLGSLAYTLDGDNYVAEWDGSNPVRIADGRPPSDCHDVGEYFAEGSIWSPDGRYLAYRHGDCNGPRDGWWDVVISDPQGNVVTSFPSEGWGISWSPDSTHVAVWDRWDEGTIGVYGLDGVRQTLLDVPPGVARGESDPVWSPDGGSFLVGNFEIPLDGSPPRRLPWADGRVAWATLSPDGSRVAYTTRKSFVIAEADGSNPREVFADFAAFPLWSPTGDRIAFVSFVSTPFDSSGQLRVLDVATGTVTLLAESEGSEFLAYMAGAGFEFSPEGDRILFSKTDDGGAGVSSLWSVKVDGSDLRRLVTGTAWGDWLSPSQAG